MPTDAKHTDVVFPLSGISRSAAFDQQRPAASKTTVLGVNVRSFECITGRGRGGSRPGVSQYLTSRVGNTTGLLQGLDFVISTDYAATLAAGDDESANRDEDAGVPWIDDTSTSNGQNPQLGPGVGHTGPETSNGNNPGVTGGPGTVGPRRPTRPPGTVRRIRPGGSGVQPNRRYPLPVIRLTITADDQDKDVGQVFTFDGDEYTQTGLQ